MRRANENVLGSLLKQYRATRGLTQEMLAERAGISVRTIKGMERGERRLPRPDTLTRLISALQLLPQEEAALRSAARNLVSPYTSSRVARDVLPMGGAGTLTPLIGREEVIQHALSLLSDEDTRLLTLVGPPGVGKTRIGMEIAQRVANSAGWLADQVVGVALAPVQLPALLLPVIARAMGIHEAQGETLLEAFESAVHGRRTLLLLDNFEHLRAAAGDLISLLTRCPEVIVLITSRAALRIRAEREVPILPLTVPARPGELRGTCSRERTTMIGSNEQAQTRRGQRRGEREDWFESVGDTPGHSRESEPAERCTTVLVEELRQVPSVALFVQRTRAILPSFELDEIAAPVVAEICRRLDGLPLAIELAAAHCRLFSPQALLTRLASQLPLLADRAVDVPPRQQTMRDAIAWSYHLLSEREQFVFRQLAICTNMCSLEAAVSICAPGDNYSFILEDLATLAAHSLIGRVEGVEGAPYITMLETIHEYARDQLEKAGERTAAERRYCAYYCSLIEAMSEQTLERGGFGLPLMDHDYANVRAALAWAIERKEIAMGEQLVAQLWRYWYTHGMLTEGRRWAEALLETIGDADQRWLDSFPASGRSASWRAPSHQENLTGADDHDGEDAIAFSGHLAEVLSGAGMLAFRQGDYAQSTAWLARCLALHRWRGDTRSTAAVLNNLGIVSADQGHYAEAQRLHSESLALKRTLGVSQDVAVSLNNLGCVVRAQGQYALARTCFEESLAIQRTCGNTYRIAHAIGNMGTLAYAEGDIDKAVDCYTECLDLQYGLDDTQGIALSHLNLGEVMAARGDCAQALVHLRESLRRFRALGEQTRIAAALVLIGSLSCMQGDTEQAVIHLQEALGLYRQLGGHRTAPTWAVALAKLAQRYRLLVSAVQSLAAAQTLRTMRSAVWMPAEQRQFDLLAASLRDELGEEAFQAVWDEAAMWSWDDLMASARRLLGKCGKGQGVEVST